MSCWKEHGLWKLQIRRGILLSPYILVVVDSAPCSRRSTSVSSSGHIGRSLRSPVSSSGQ